MIAESVNFSFILFLTHFLQQAACLARCNGAMAELVRYDSLSEEKFRATVQEICASDQQHVIVSYSRKQFLQTGWQLLIPKLHGQALPEKCVLSR